MQKINYTSKIHRKSVNKIPLICIKTHLPLKGGYISVYTLFANHQIDKFTLIVLISILLLSHSTVNIFYKAFFPGTFAPTIFSQVLGDMYCQKCENLYMSNDVQNTTYGLNCEQCTNSIVSVMTISVYVYLKQSNCKLLVYT